MTIRAVFNGQVLLCALVVAGSLAGRRVRGAGPRRFDGPATAGRRRRSLLVCMAPLLALSVVVYLPSLNDPFLADDFALIHSATPTPRIDQLLAPTLDANVRPVGQLVFSVYRHFGSFYPIRWHALSLAVHSLNVLLIFLLTLRLSGDPFVAFVAGAIFATTPSHLEAVEWTAALYDLLAACFCLLALLLATVRRFAGLLGCAAATALAILSKESSYALPLLAVFSLAAFLRPSKTLAIRIGAISIVALGLFAQRWSAFHGPGGYLDPNTGEALILESTPLSVAKVLFYRPWRTFILPVDLARDGGPFLILLCAVVLALYALAAFAHRVRRKQHSLLLCAVVAALIPPLHLALVGPDLAGTRVFYLGSIFFSIWAATLLGTIPGKRLRATLIAGVVLVPIALLEWNLSLRTRVAETADRSALTWRGRQSTARAGCRFEASRTGSTE